MDEEVDGDTRDRGDLSPGKECGKLRSAEKGGFCNSMNYPSADEERQTNSYPGTRTPHVVRKRQMTSKRQQSLCPSAHFPPQSLLQRQNSSINVNELQHVMRALGRMGGWDKWGRMRVPVSRVSRFTF